MDMGLSELQALVADREAWRAAIRGVTKSRTRLSDWTEPTWDGKTNKRGRYLEPERDGAREERNGKVSGKHGRWMKEKMKGGPEEFGMTREDGP